MKRLAALWLLASIAATPASGSAVDGRPAREVALGAADRLQTRYVFPGPAVAAAQFLRRNAEAGAYDTLADKDLATRLTSDIATVLHDKHVRVIYSTVPRMLPVPNDRYNGYGLGRIAHLLGNVGYVDLRDFARASPDAKRVLDAAMDAVSSSDVLILDLRRNLGGDPESVARLLSHVLPVRTHLTDFIGRDGAVESSTFTVALPTPPMTVPLYVLTSAETFSGGEECAYDLQALKRATLVGAVTGGGANPGGFVPIDDRFTIFIPDHRPRNAVTKTNWEGSGVRPDVAVASDQALVVAYELALDRKLRDATLPPMLRANIASLRARLESMTEAEVFAL